MYFVHRWPVGEDGPMLDKGFVGNSCFVMNTMLWRAILRLNIGPYLRANLWISGSMFDGSLSFRNNFMSDMMGMVEMKGIISVTIFVLVAAHINIGLALQSTVPAFVWSQEPLDSGMNVDYRTILQKDLAKFVLSKGGWSKLLCTGEKARRLVDVALVFVGKELQSSAISGNKHKDPTLLHLIKDSFSRSNFSMAFPFVAASEESSKMEDSLITGFTEHCGHGLEHKMLLCLSHDYLVSRVEKRQEGQTDLIILCSGSSDSSELDGAWSEGEALSELINYVEQSGSSYTVLYASDPRRSMQYSSYKTLARFLAEGGNGSDNSTTYCDGVCHIKSSLLEGLLVAIVLLIILISGLCCMMGIDTPTRFEAPLEN
ncbi:hypothetical protein Sjap_004027 [Stephania japonica]|uniref:V-type proton ATPase subunit S1/VOA1 transmembrane domain-containing protein n=1 Tax=Stephania japonica TaxID=461633 RepID=A0AAP0K2A5_9MAGN